MDLVYKGHTRFPICCNIVTHICELCVWQMLRSEDCHIACRRRRRAMVGLFMSESGHFSDFLVVLISDSIIIIVGKKIILFKLVI